MVLLLCQVAEEGLSLRWEGWTEFFLRPAAETWPPLLRLQLLSDSLGNSKYFDPMSCTYSSGNFPFNSQDLTESRVNLMVQLCNELQHFSSCHTVTFHFILQTFHYTIRNFHSNNAK